MAKITQERVAKINNMCSNEFILDVKYFLFHNEKTLIKRIRLDEQNFLEYRLSYNSQNQICLHISKFYHEPQDEMASTSGMGKNKVLVETPAKRKDVNKLILLTKDLTNERLLDINKNTPVATGYGLISQSEEF